jgi:hypothetical protein
MSETLIRLDRSRPFGECRGERTPDDPLYRVHFWQGGKVGRDTVLLPFDSNGELVADDGKDVKFIGMGPEGKPIEYHPLYNTSMRAYLAAKRSRLATATSLAPVEDDGLAEPVEGSGGSAEDDVNFESFLRGEVRYQPFQLRMAAKKRYHKNYSAGDQFMRSLIEDLVRDEKLIPEDELCPQFKRLLPQS